MRGGSWTAVITAARRACLEPDMPRSRYVPARARLASLLLLLLAETDALHLALASRGATRLLSCAHRPAALVMETMETNTREGIMSRGHPHTEQSRMKISQANKGKTPWNIGKKHSEETKRKIAVKTREAYLRRKEAEEMRIQTEEPEKWAAMLAEKEAVVTRAVRAKEEKAAAVIAKTAKVCCCRRRCTRPSRHHPVRHRPAATALAATAPPATTPTATAAAISA